MYIALGTLLGLAAGILAAFVRHGLDTRVKDGNALAEAVGAPLVGVIANDRHARRRPLVVSHDPQSAQAEAYRRLRTNLAGLASHRAINSVVVSSALEGEGKTVVIANLGLAFAQAGYRVVLVDADLRRPRLAEYLGLSRTTGLADALRTGTNVEDLLQTCGDGFRLEVLASGVPPANPSDLLGSQRVATVIETLTQRSDIVLLDAPAVLPVIDAAVLARRTSGLVLVARAGSTRVPQLTAAADAVRATGGEVLGAVLTQVPRGALPKYYREPAARRGAAPGPRGPSPLDSGHRAPRRRGTPNSGVEAEGLRVRSSSGARVFGRPCRRRDLLGPGLGPGRDDVRRAAARARLLERRHPAITSWIASVPDNSVSPSTPARAIASKARSKSRTGTGSCSTARGRPSEQRQQDAPRTARSGA